MSRAIVDTENFPRNSHGSGLGSKTTALAGPDICGELGGGSATSERRWGDGGEDALTASTHAELVQALTFGLRFDERGKSHRLAMDSMANIAAETLARYLDQAGFVVMKRPALKPNKAG